jgi:serine O-acetyltransferase
MTTSQRLLRSLRRRSRVLLRPGTKRSGRLMNEVRAQHPAFKTAVLADLRVTAGFRNERSQFRSKTDAVVSVVRLAIVSDTFFAQCCYRAKARAQTLGIPLLPSVLHRLAIVTGQISIGDPVVLAPGVYIPHGQIVVDGFTTIGAGAILAPFVSIGLVAGTMKGPTIGARASIGTGARVLGPVRVGTGAKVGANAVVLSDVPDYATAIGAPARSVGPKPRTR